MSGNTYERMVEAIRPLGGCSLDRTIRECAHIANEMRNEQLAEVERLRQQNLDMAYEIERLRAER